MSKRRSPPPPLKDWHLWDRVAETVDPLRPRPLRPAPPSETALPTPPQPPMAMPKPPRPLPPMPSYQPTGKPGQPPRPGIEPNLRQRLVRGRDQIDGTIDLHGMRQVEAHAALTRFIHARAARGDRTLLVDTGIGPGPVALFGHSRGQLMEELARHGVAPEDIHLVFLTHLHPDHVGWNLTEGKPSFPNARYIASRSDWEVFHTPEVKAFMESLVPGCVERDVTPLAQLGVLDLIEGETEILPGVRAFPTPGHTTGHMSLHVTSGSQQALILGDVFHHPAQVQVNEICIAFDMDPPAAIQTRRRIVEWAAAEGMPLAGCHLLPHGLGRIARRDGAFAWEAL